MTAVPGGRGQTDAAHALPHSDQSYLESRHPYGPNRCHCPARSRTARSRQVSDSTIQRLFILPTLILLILWNIFPLFYSLFLSFTQYSHSGKLPPLWVGTANYDALLSDPKVWRSFAVTGTYALLSVAVSGDRRLWPGDAAAREVQGQRAAHHADPDPDDALAGGRRSVLEADLRPDSTAFSTT